MALLRIYDLMYIFHSNLSKIGFINVINFRTTVMMSEGLVNIIVIQLVPSVLRTTIFIYFPAQFC